MVHNFECDRVYQIDFTQNFSEVHCCYLDVRLFLEHGIYRTTGLCPDDSQIRSCIHDLSEYLGFHFPVSKRSTKKDRLIQFISYLLCMFGFPVEHAKSYRFIVCFKGSKLVYFSPSISLVCESYTNYI